MERDLEMEHDIDIETLHYLNQKPKSVGSIISYISSKISKSSRDENYSKHTTVSVDTNYEDFKEFCNKKRYTATDFIPTLDSITATVNDKSNSNSNSNKTKSI